MNRVVLADGYEIKDGSISVSGVKQIMVFFPGTDLSEAIRLFSDPNKTMEMTCYYSVYKVVYTGYTEISSLSVNPQDNCVQIMMNGNIVTTVRDYTVSETYLPKEMRKEQEDEREDDAE